MSQINDNGPSIRKRRERPPANHPFRPTLTPGGKWCIHPAAGKTCGQVAEHPIHKIAQDPPQAAAA